MIKTVACMHIPLMTDHINHCVHEAVHSHLINLRQNIMGPTILLRLKTIVGRLWPLSAFLTC